MLHSDRDTIYLLNKAKERRSSLIACLILCAGIIMPVLGISSVSYAFESLSAVRIIAEFVSPGRGGAGLPDIDKDGMPDEWEEKYGFDPGDPDDAYLDTDNDGINNLEEFRLDTNPIISNSGITAIITATPASGIQPQDITFKASVAGNVYPIAKYEWDFDGKGTYDQWSYASESSTATYKYTASGSFNVRLRVTDSVGGTAVSARTIDIARNNAASPPVANPELSFAEITVPTTLPLNATASDNDKVVRYEWDTDGNGEYDIISTKSANATKIYNKVITRSLDASFKVTDTDGLSDIASVGIKTDATEWDDSPYRPKVYLNDYVIYGTAGVPVSLRGYGKPDLGYAKKLEWDFEDDGISDWVSMIENKDFNGKADVEHTYGAPGIYRAVLTVNTEANVSASDSILVIISANGLPPKAAATVSYKSYKDLTSVSGTVPLSVSFDHSSSLGNIANYEWDFDGDKKIDFSTKTAKKPAKYDYTEPGYYVACLRVTDINGLTATFYVPVFVHYPSIYSSSIKIPEDGQVVAGNAVTLVSEVSPDDVNVKKVMFQYRKSGQTAWTNIGQGKVVLSYMTSWNTKGLEDKATYELRASVNDLDSESFIIRSVVVDNQTSTPDIFENNNGTHEKKMKVDPMKKNTIVLANGTRIEIPEGALADKASTPVITVEEIIGRSAGVGNSWEINLTGNNQFLKDITISIPYPDADNDGIVDGTGINENNLVIQWFNPDSGAWQPLYDSIVYPDENFVSGKVNHLSLFGLGAIFSGGGAAAGGSGGVFASAAKGGSYCFIATAAYGTPMAEEINALREFRDSYLLKDGLGKKFVWYYYTHSPVVARFIEDKPLLRAIVRLVLKPLVDISKVMVRLR